mmetsp:Transcript_5034/g.18123  ORF Transcript_5034/g.18123 Transcript_5034/m.18123 type:complete len:200 (-) Transcript_5034:2647-3246(-)
MTYVYFRRQVQLLFLDALQDSVDQVLLLFNEKLFSDVPQQAHSQQMLRLKLTNVERKLLEVQNVLVPARQEILQRDPIISLCWFLFRTIIIRAVPVQLYVELFCLLPIQSTFFSVQHLHDNPTNLVIRISEMNLHLEQVLRSVTDTAKTNRHTVQQLVIIFANTTIITVPVWISDLCLGAYTNISLVQDNNRSRTEWCR